MIQHFGNRKNETVLELGCAAGGTTDILVHIFRLVICIDRELNNQRISNYHPNLIRLSLDLYAQEWTVFANSNVIDVVFIDALHSERFVQKDLANVLQKIRCCVHTIFFHDFYFEGVYT